MDSIQTYIGHQTADQMRNESGVLVAALGAPRSNSCESGVAPVRQVATSGNETLLARLERRIAELEAKVEAVERGPTRGVRECFAREEPGRFRSQCEHKNASCSQSARGVGTCRKSAG